MWQRRRLKVCKNRATASSCTARAPCCHPERPDAFYRGAKDLHLSHRPEPRSLVILIPQSREKDLHLSSKRYFRPSLRTKNLYSFVSNAHWPHGGSYFPSNELCCMCSRRIKVLTSC